jgi:hypothetical protein
MPASITHMLISRRVRDRLRQMPELANFVNAVLDKHSQYMELGSLGPDLPYFESWKSLVNPNKPMGVDPWSYQLHSKSPNLFPLLMMEIIGKESDPQVADWEDRDNLKVAYLCGFLTHVAADQTIHPIVNAVAGPYYFKPDARTEHRNCEVHQDLYVLSQEYGGRLTRKQFKAERFDSRCNPTCDGRRPVTFKKTGLIRTVLAMLIAAFRSPCPIEFIYLLQKTFVEAHAVTPTPNLTRRWIKHLQQALRLCNHIPFGWYSSAFWNLFRRDGTPKTESLQYRDYVLLKGLKNKRHDTYDGYLDEAIELAIIYIRAAHQLYMATRIDDPLRQTFRTVVVNADLGAPLEQDTLKLASGHFENWGNIIQRFADLLAPAVDATVASTEPLEGESPA